LWLLRRYHPGAVLIVGVAMGAGLSLPGIFVRPFAAQLGIPGIALFFTIYPCTAFAVRMATRRWSRRYGVRPMILAGVGSLSLGMLAFLLVGTAWHLAAPAVLIGIAHALLFPNVVASGSGSFPARYRGLGTTLVLGMFDIGNLFGAPLVGGILKAATTAGIPAYPTMFATIAGVLALIGAAYAVASRRKPALPKRDPRSVAGRSSQELKEGLPLSREAGDHHANCLSVTSLSPRSCAAWRLRPWAGST
jgi:MFS family permease